MLKARHSSFLRSVVMLWNRERGGKLQGVVMFRVKGMLKESREYHEKLIGEVASRDIGAGIVLAAVYFEWCVRRSIVALGKSPVATLNAKLNSEILSFDKLLGLWKSEVSVEYAGRKIANLPDVFDLRKNKPVYGTLKLMWKDIDKARRKRNELVHGGHCAPLEKHGMKYVALLIDAAHVLSELCENYNCPIFEVIPANRRRSGR